MGNDLSKWSATNSPAMNRAIEWCNENGVTFKQVSKYQIKIDDVSYYPDSETVIFDNQKKERFGCWDMFRKIAINKKKLELKFLAKSQKNDL